MRITVYIYIYTHNNSMFVPFAQGRSDPQRSSNNLLALGHRMVLTCSHHHGWEISATKWWTFQCHFDYQSVGLLLMCITRKLHVPKTSLLWYAATVEHGHGHAKNHGFHPCLGILSLHFARNPSVYTPIWSLKPMVCCRIFLNKY